MYSFKFLQCKATLNKVRFSLLERYANRCIKKAVQEGNGDVFIKEF